MSAPAARSEKNRDRGHSASDSLSRSGRDTSMGRRHAGLMPALLPGAGGGRRIRYALDHRRPLDRHCGRAPHPLARQQAPRSSPSRSRWAPMSAPTPTATRVYWPRLPILSTRSAAVGSRSAWAPAGATPSTAPSASTGTVGSGRFEEGIPHRPRVPAGDRTQHLPWHLVSDRGLRVAPARATSRRLADPSRYGWRRPPHAPVQPPGMPTSGPSCCPGPEPATRPASPRCGRRPTRLAARSSGTRPRCGVRPGSASRWVVHASGSVPGTRQSGRSPEHLSRSPIACAAFAAEGIDQVQVFLGPTTVAGVEAFAAVLEVLDRP